MENNNLVTIGGEIASGFNYSHEVFGEKFYLFDLKVARISEAFDIIPVMISERLVDVEKDMRGTYLKIKGQYRSHNKRDGEKAHLMLSVFAKEVEIKEEIIDILDACNENMVTLDGYICKPTIYRKTPLGREIADVLLAVNRPYGKTDYIPMIMWGRNARYVSELPVGTRLNVFGRLQSRTYMKQISETESESRTAYEVSVTRFLVVKEDN